MLSANSPPLLSLPLELREQIYSQALSHPSNGPQLLGTCHEIYTEARKFLFQRPLVFHGQSAFYRWLAITPSNYLHHVSEIVLELHDVDLEPLLGNAADAMQKSSVPRLLAWELYGQELERLQAALQKVHKVKLFTLRALEDQQSFLYRNFLGKVLEMLGPLYPDLQHLGLAGNFHYQSLTFLSALSQLRSFSFDGFTSSSPPETAEILSSLQHLSSLSLVSQYTLLTPTTTPHVHSAYTSKPQSFTGAVLRTMNHLASFSVTEPLRPACSPTLFLVPELLAPLHTHAALRRLAIALAYTPDKETLAALEDFMRKAPIERLELDWPQLLPEVLEEYVLVGGKDLPAPHDSDETNVARATRRLHALGVRVEWCTEGA
ncbi:hypothetical protein BDV95DRAFT_606444 [Massariosphaeria phaeospora]|uniref:F-box domain-containing protein n=1 Tax=Massariosphaeria phaeospora TaxID=100035 RepID=A0A7C8I9V2_9PLEO|nr:hypothetical protein BDV95DRAFT_606444 [Massariosphaeria phaeospora]